MKISIIAILLMVFLSCSRNTSGLYRIDSIDSVASYYLIYAIRNDSTYKIVSRKEHLNSCNRIYKNEAYSFDLHSALHDWPPGIKIIPKENFVYKCLEIEDSQQICIDNGSVDIYYTKELFGLCYVKK